MENNKKDKLKIKIKDASIVATMSAILTVAGNFFLGPMGEIIGSVLGTYLGMHISYKIVYKEHNESRFFQLAFKKDSTKLLLIGILYVSFFVFWGIVAGQSISMRIEQIDGAGSVSGIGTIILGIVSGFFSFILVLHQIEKRQTKAFLYSAMLAVGGAVIGVIIALLAGGIKYKMIGVYCWIGACIGGLLGGLIATKYWSYLKENVFKKN